jgi:hypothetical protein
MFFDKRINNIKSRQNNYGLAFSVESKVIILGYKGDRFPLAPVANIVLPGAFLYQTKYHLRQ